MEATRELNRYKRLRRGLLRQVLWGRNTLLAILAVSLINQLMLVCRVEYHFLFSAAMPYYLNWLAGQLPNVTFKVVATVMTIALYLAYGGCWFFFQRREWLGAAVGIYAVDTVLLLVFALVLLDNPMSCLLELLIHGVGLVLMVQAHGACLRLSRLRAPQT